MARIHEPSKADENAWKKWLDSRSATVRAVAERFDPWSLYKMKSEHRCTIISFGEEKDGGISLRVLITGQFNRIMFDRQVFGVSPDDLEPCDLPSPDEILGAVLTKDKDIDAFVDVLARQFLRRGTTEATILEDL